MNGIEYLELILRTKSFAGYMRTQGVKEYKYFGGLGVEYKPTLADAAMYVHESLGVKALTGAGIEIDVGGNVIVDGKGVGISALASGKSTRDLTISMWLEDFGTLGMDRLLLEREMDEMFYSGWFAANVIGQISGALLIRNSARVEAEYTQRRIQRHPWWKTLWIRMVEIPSRLRLKWHYRKGGTYDRMAATRGFP